MLIGPLYCGAILSIYILSYNMVFVDISFILFYLLVTVQLSCQTFGNCPTRWRLLHAYFNSL